MSTAIGHFKHEQLNLAPLAVDEIRCLSVLQPWASALFLTAPDGSSLKRIETRSFRTNYRGRLYIHASKGFPKYARVFAEEEWFMTRLPKPSALLMGVIIGHVDLIDITPTNELRPNISAIEELYGDYSPRRFGWITENPILLDEPIPARGSLGLWKFIQGGEK